MSALVAANLDPPLSPARAELAAAQAALAEATRDLEAASAPLRRVEGVALEASEVERELAASRADDANEVGNWIASGGQNERPQPSVATLRLERRLAELSKDLPGVESVHQAHLAAVQAATARVAACAKARDDALCWAACDAVAGYSSVWLDALNAALRHQALLEGLRDELQAIGHRAEGSIPALAAAARMTELILQTRSAAGVPRNPGAGRALIAALAANPSAELGG